MSILPTGINPPNPPAQPPITNWTRLENALFGATGSRSLTIPADTSTRDRTEFLFRQAGVIMKAMESKQFRSNLTNTQRDQLRSTMDQFFRDFLGPLLRPQT